MQGTSLVFLDGRYILGNAIHPDVSKEPNPLHLQGKVLKDISNLGGPNKIYVITQVQPLCKTRVKTKKKKETWRDVQYTCLFSNAH
jgi:hypothetical protein